MLLFLIRHGDPIYDPDSLTPLGEQQAEAVAKRLAAYGLDEIYVSTSNRAIMTARPTCELLGMEATRVEFANEGRTWEGLSIDRGDGSRRTWLFYDRRSVELFTTPEMRALGDRWYDHPEMKPFGFEKGLTRLYDETDEFLAGLGYEHIRYTGRYNPVAPSEKRVALFAHQGFGIGFLSCMLDIPYPAFCTHFDICHSGMTVINFRTWDGFAVPKVLTLSSDAHLYREGLPTLYNNEVTF